MSIIGSTLLKQTLVRQSALTRSTVVWALLSIVCLLVQGCASPANSNTEKTVQSTKKELTDDFFTPKGALAAAAKTKKIDLPTQYPKFASTAKPQAFELQVLVYNSPSNKAFFETAGLNVANVMRAWDTFLKKYQFPYKQITEVGQLERSGSGLLILPSTVALSNRERQAIIDFRARGGSVLSTWLCGVRNEQGVWQGFDFMEQVLDVKVLGDTAANKDDNFLLPHGQSPISNVLQAGERIWLERAKHWLPLRLNGRYMGGQIMDWSRTFTANKHTGAIVFDERPIGTYSTSNTGTSSHSSRSVSLAYPERLWQTAEPKQLEALHHNVISWLLRLPSAYKATWPEGYHSALLLAVDAAEVVADSDLAIAKLMEQNGVKGTYYTLSDHLSKSAKNLVTLQQRGHEIAFMGDVFDGFKGQPQAVQAGRIDKARKLTQDAQVVAPTNPGFHAPTESFDKTTKELLVQRGFGHYIDTMEASEARLPFTIASGNNPPLVVFPRTQRGPEDATEEGDVDEGIQSFLDEFNLSVLMRGLNVIRMPTQSLLPFDDWNKIFDGIKENSKGVWMTTATQIAQWWRNQEKVRIALRGDFNHTELIIEVAGKEPIAQPVVAMLNLPQLNSRIAINKNNPLAEKVKIVALDRWRAGLVLTDIPPGNHRIPVEISN